MPALIERVVRRTMNLWHQQGSVGGFSLSTNSLLGLNYGEQKATAL